MIGGIVMAILIVAFIAVTSVIIVYDEYRIKNVATRIRETYNNDFTVEYYGKSGYGDGMWMPITPYSSFNTYDEAAAAAKIFRDNELKKYYKDKNKAVWYIK